MAYFHPREVKNDLAWASTRGECRHSKQQRSGSTTSEQQRRSEDAVDAHQGENSASGAVVEELVSVQKVRIRGGFRLALQISPVDKHALQIASFAEDVHKVGQVWPFQLPGSTSSALHADWKTNALHHQG